MVLRSELSFDAVSALKVPIIADVECSSSLASAFTFSVFFALVSAISLASSYWLLASSSICIAPKTNAGAEVLTRRTLAKS
jgi:hypothetical protein